MFPILSASLEEISRVLTKAILKQNILVLEEATIVLSLTKIDVAKSSNQLDVNQVKLGKALIQSLLSVECKPKKKRGFEKERMHVVVTLLYFCPLKYAVVRNVSSLSPNTMVEEKEISKMKFQVLAERLIKLKRLTANEADYVDLQYDEFADSECSKHREKFATFNKSTAVVDLFFADLLYKN